MTSDTLAFLPNLLYFPYFSGLFREAERPPADTDVMTVREMAEYLKVKDRTIYRLVARRDIPEFKVGCSWRFMRSEMDKWTAANAVGPDCAGEEAERKQ